MTVKPFLPFQISNSYAMRAFYFANYLKIQFK